MTNENRHFNGHFDLLLHNFLAYSFVRGGKHVLHRDQRLFEETMWIVSHNLETDSVPHVTSLLLPSSVHHKMRRAFLQLYYKYPGSVRCCAALYIFLGSQIAYPPFPHERAPPPTNEVHTKHVCTRMYHKWNVPYLPFLLPVIFIY